MRKCLLAIFIPLIIFGAPSYYLTWNHDPTTTMIISWLETDKQYAFAFYDKEWKSPVFERIDLGENTTLARVELTNLQPATSYPLRFDNEDTHQYFTTLPNQLDQPLKFVAGGDVFYGSGKLYRQMCQTVAKETPAFVVLGGDIAYTLKGSLSIGSLKWELARWRTFFDIWSETLGSTPILVAAGNHDISKKIAQPALFAELFALPHTYRTLQLGNFALLLLLDTGHYSPIQGEQTAWLDNELKQYAHIPFKSAHYHIAAYPSYAPFNGSKPQKIRNHWVPLFEKYKLTVGFEHHNHTYKRTYPLINSKPNSNGIVYLGDGSWGVSPRPIHPAPYLAHAASINAFYLVTLSQDQHQIEAYDIEGHLIESIKTR